MNLIDTNLSNRIAEYFVTVGYENILVPFHQSYIHDQFAEIPQPTDITQVNPNMVATTDCDDSINDFYQRPTVSSSSDCKHISEDSSSCESISQNSLDSNRHRDDMSAWPQERIDALVYERTRVSDVVLQAIEDHLFEPFVLDRYPAYDRAPTSLPPGIQLFCLPRGGLQIRRSPDMPQIYYFACTMMNGDRMYGACLSFQEALPTVLTRNLFRLFESHHAAFGVQLPTQSAVLRPFDLQRSVWESVKMVNPDTIPLEVLSHVQHETPELPTLWTNHCLCVLSYYPFLSEFRTFLTELYRLTLTPSFTPLEHNISMLFDCTPLPPLGMCSVQLNIGPLEPHSDSFIRNMSPISSTYSQQIAHAIRLLNSRKMGGTLLKGPKSKSGMAVPGVVSSDTLDNTNTIGGCGDGGDGGGEEGAPSNDQPQSHNHSSQDHDQNQNPEYPFKLIPSHALSSKLKYHLVEIIQHSFHFICGTLYSRKNAGSSGGDAPDQPTNSLLGLMTAPPASLCSIHSLSQDLLEDFPSPLDDSQLAVESLYRLSQTVPYQFSTASPSSSPANSPVTFQGRMGSAASPSNQVATPAPPKERGGDRRGNLSEEQTRPSKSPHSTSTPMHDFLKFHQTSTSQGQGNSRFDDFRQFQVGQKGGNGGESSSVTSLSSSMTASSNADVSQDQDDSSTYQSSTMKSPGMKHTNMFPSTHTKYINHQLYPSPQSFRSIVFSRPPYNDPIFPSPIRVSSLFLNLDVNHIISIIEALLLERKVIILSERLSLLVQVCESLLLLLYPFRWQHVYIPLLPKALNSFLIAPMPYLIGASTSVAQMLMEIGILPSSTSSISPPSSPQDVSDDHVVVFLDHNRVISQTPILRLPTQIREKLTEKLLPIASFLLTKAGVVLRESPNSINSPTHRRPDDHQSKGGKIDGHPFVLPLESKLTSNNKSQKYACNYFNPNYVDSAFPIAPGPDDVDVDIHDYELVDVPLENGGGYYRHVLSSYQTDPDDDQTNFDPVTVTSSHALSRNTTPKSHSRTLHQTSSTSTVNTSRHNTPSKQQRAHQDDPEAVDAHQWLDDGPEQLSSNTIDDTTKDLNSFLTPSPDRDVPSGSITSSSTSRSSSSSSSLIRSQALHSTSRTTQNDIAITYTKIAQIKQLEQHKWDTVLEAEYAIKQSFLRVYLALFKNYRNYAVSLLPYPQFLPDGWNRLAVLPSPRVIPSYRYARIDLNCLQRFNSSHHIYQSRNGAFKKIIHALGINRDVQLDDDDDDDDDDVSLPSLLSDNDTQRVAVMMLPSVPLSQQQHVSNSTMFPTDILPATVFVSQPKEKTTGRHVTKQPLDATDESTSTPPSKVKSHVVAGCKYPSGFKPLFSSPPQDLYRKKLETIGQKSSILLLKISQYEDHEKRLSFRRDAFLSSIYKGEMPFLHPFVGTQAFSRFIEERTSPSLAKENAHHFAFFEESIEKKSNRSFFSLAQSHKTPFLDLRCFLHHSILLVPPLDGGIRGHHHYPLYHGSTSSSHASTSHAEECGVLLRCTGTDPSVQQTPLAPSQGSTPSQKNPSSQPLSRGYFTFGFLSSNSGAAPHSGNTPSSVPTGMSSPSAQPLSSSEQDVYLLTTTYLPKPPHSLVNCSSPHAGAINATTNGLPQQVCTVLGLVSHQHALRSVLSKRVECHSLPITIPPISYQYFPRFNTELFPCLLGRVPRPISIDGANILSFIRLRVGILLCTCPLNEASAGSGTVPSPPGESKLSSDSSRHPHSAGIPSHDGGHISFQPIVIPLRRRYLRVVQDYHSTEEDTELHFHSLSSMSLVFQWTTAPFEDLTDHILGYVDTGGLPTTPSAPEATKNYLDQSHLSQADEQSYEPSYCYYIPLQTLAPPVKHPFSSSSIHSSPPTTTQFCDPPLTFNTINTANPLAFALQQYYDWLATWDPQKFFPKSLK